MAVTHKEIKKRMASPPKPAGETPVWARWVQKQLVLIQQENESNGKVQTAQLHLLERVHDRLEAIAVESRVTNMLLSELVAIHQSVITEDTDQARESIREEVYHRVLNAE